MWFSGKRLAIAAAILMIMTSVNPVSAQVADASISGTAWDDVNGEVPMRTSTASSGNSLRKEPTYPSSPQTTSTNTHDYSTILTRDTTQNA